MENKQEVSFVGPLIDTCETLPLILEGALRNASLYESLVRLRAIMTAEATDKMKPASVVNGEKVAYSFAGLRVGLILNGNELNVCKVGDDPELAYRISFFVDGGEIVRIQIAFPGASYVAFVNRSGYAGGYDLNGHTTLNGIVRYCEFIQSLATPKNADIGAQPDAGNRA